MIAMPENELSATDRAELTRLEEAMWTPDTRFDLQFQEARFALDFLEFGRSGRVYRRADVICAGGAHFTARLR